VNSSSSQHARAYRTPRNADRSAAGRREQGAGEQEFLEPGVFPVERGRGPAAEPPLQVQPEFQHGVSESGGGVVHRLDRSGRFADPAPEV
jgi:hypothetical protein